MESTKAHFKNRNLKDISEEVEGIIYKEEWKDIFGYEGIYQVSNFGRVKSLARNVLKRYKNKKEVSMPYKAQILAIVRENNGYNSIGLSIDKYYKRFLVHRLVAQHFILNPENKPQVNHLKGVKWDNRFFRLEWATRSENHKHSFLFLGRKATRNFGMVSTQRKSVIRFDNTTGEETKYLSITEAALKNGIVTSSIFNRIKMVIKRPHRYNWKYA